MKLDKNILVPELWKFAVLFYFLRSIAEPLRYLFFIFFGLLMMTFSFCLVRDFSGKRMLEFLRNTKEFQILGLFLAVGILSSSPVEVLSLKSLVNFLAITFFYFVYFEYRDFIQLRKFFTVFIISMLTIGTVGILKWLNFLLNLNTGLFTIFYKDGSSLVPEYNFYACFFIASVIIYFWALKNNMIKAPTGKSLLFLIVLLLNILLSGSRRGLILTALLLIYSIYLLITRRKENREPFYRVLLYLNSFIYGILIILICLVPFRSGIIRNDDLQTKISLSVFRYVTIFIPNISYTVLSEKLWPQSSEYANDNTDWNKYATYNNLVDGGIKNSYRSTRDSYWVDFEHGKQSRNLMYNGNFKYGLKFWEKITPDSVKQEIIRTKYGNAVRVTRSDGKGYWPLAYNGRKIFYYAGVTYTFRFKYRVLKGSGEFPFMIGWWLKEGQGFKNNLNHLSRKLDLEWYECTASYKFLENHSDITTFMNSQAPNTVVDFTDIELTCNDSLNRPLYLDQVDPAEGINLLYNGNFENGLDLWGSLTKDSISHKIIDTQYGKAIRVSRNEGKGYWPLIYTGRTIYYYKGRTYSFRFKFRVVDGSDTPFMIGWALEKDEPAAVSLKKDIFPLGKGWMECIASYTFAYDHFDKIATFMNNQDPHTIIDFADIELICNDTMANSDYVDERIGMLKDLEKARIEKQLSAEKEKLFSERLDRWKFAAELYIKDYNIKNKLFGKGFDYLKAYGQKFYPDENRLDYPHNPVLSAILYSGMAGGFFYIYFLVCSLWYYYKYRKRLLLLFLIYIVVLFFVFISSDSHFDTPVFAFLSLVPFLSREEASRE